MRTERVADGVWVVRGGFPSKTMNVYLIEEDGGVAMFDAGISDMTAAVRAAGARLGGIRRVVLGHADADHRGTAPGVGAPVYCHPAEREAAESSDAWRYYWDFSKLKPYGRVVLKRAIPIWDGGAVKIAGTVEEGDDVAGFRVVDLPGHAPGLIGLFRESDRLALTSDCFYTLDPQTGIKGRARVPHPAFNISTGQAAESIAKLAALEPSAAWAGPRGPGPRRRRLTAPASRGRRSSLKTVGRRQRQRREKLQAPSAEYRDEVGNVLVLRGSLTPGARREYAATLGGRP